LIESAIAEVATSTALINYSWLNGNLSQHSTGVDWYTLLIRNLLADPFTS